MSLMRSHSKKIKGMRSRTRGVFTVRSFDMFDVVPGRDDVERKASSSRIPSSN